MCFDVLEHLLDPSQQLLQFYQALNSEGKMIVNWYFFKGFNQEFPFHLDDHKVVETFFHTLQSQFLEVFHPFCSQPGSYLAWVGRIAPEKGLEDGVAAAKIAGMPMKIFGLKQDVPYWEQICQEYPDAPIEYRGFLPTHELQQELGQCKALLITPRWIEAYPNVALEALACGVPLISYRRGGLTEIVQEGKTGFLVEPDSVQGLVEAIKHLDEIDRQACRQ